MRYDDRSEGAFGVLLFKGRRQFGSFSAVTYGASDFVAMTQKLVDNVGAYESGGTGDHYGGASRNDWSGHLRDL